MPTVKRCRGWGIILVGYEESRHLLAHFVHVLYMSSSCCKFLWHLGMFQHAQQAVV